MPSTYDRIRDLPLRVEGSGYERRAQAMGPEFVRVTTVVTLHGAGERGAGEDVGWEEIEHERLVDAGPIAELAGDWTIDSFSRALAAAPLFPEPPAWEIFRNYRRWAFESAALDLALRQNGLALHEVLDRTPAPLRFVASRGLGDPPDAAPILDMIACVPGITFKLDAEPSWDDPLVATLAETGRVVTIDLKGHYENTMADPGADPDLYRRVAEAFPDVWLEDPRLTDRTRPAITPHWERVTWDATLHSRADLAALDPAPRAINIKPCRFGALSELLGVYDDVAAAGIAAYGGGMGELGPGRDQIQYLAALFHPDGPNDVAPREFNLPELPSALPASPLHLSTRPSGFALA